MAEPHERTASDYLQPGDLGGNGVVSTMIKGLEVETVDGRPRLVIYFFKLSKGLLLDRQAYEELADVLGPHPVAEAFFSSPEGKLQ